ncbi:MAG: CHAT domain-containing tetratricopeptide repeat protein [Ignavibacteriota bacterium]
MKFLFGTLTLLTFFFSRESSAQQTLQKGLEEKLDSLYLIAEYSQGEQLVRSTLQSSTTSQSEPGNYIATLHLQLGIFSQELGKFAEAENQYLLAEKIFQTSPQTDQGSIGSVLSRLSVLYAEQGRFADARSTAAKQFSLYSATFGKDHKYTALASIVLALQLSNSGSPDSASLLLNEYRPILLQSFGEISKEASRLHEAEGRVAFAMKQYIEAEKYFVDARKTASNTPGDKHPLTARIALALAQTRLILGKIDSADANIEDALSVALRSSGPAHPFTAECYITKATIEEASGRIPAAYNSYKKAIEVYKEATRENFRYTSERERLAFIRNVKEQLSRLSSTSLRTSAFYPSGLEVCYDGILFQKGIVLSSLQAMRRRAIQSGDSTIHRLLDELAEIRSRRSALVRGVTGMKNPFLDQDSLSEISNSIEKELARNSGPFNDLENLGKISWKEIQQSLSPGKVAIEIDRFEYYDGERKTDTAFYISLILAAGDSPHPRLAIIGNAKDLEDSSVIRQYFRSLERQSKKRSSTSTLISKLLWSPIESYLSGASSVIISPDGIYHQLSLAALGGEDGKLLAEHFQIITAPSTADILLSPSREPMHSISLFADPQYSSGAKSEVSALSQLPGTLKEEQAIEKFFEDAKWQVHAFTGENATEKNVKLLRHPSILHIATHGKFDGAFPLSATESHDDPSGSYMLDHSLISSALYFAGANQTLSRGSGDAEDDGVLTALEAMDLDLQTTDLVTLSACESGKGIIQPGEGAFGLARAFRTAGARNILMSLWQVPDKETKELMTAFYKNYLSNQSKGEALRNAQLEERNIIKKRYGDDIPYFWAGFVLIGF